MSTVTVEQNANLERLLLSNRDMEARVRQAVAKALAQARSQVASAARSAIGNDKRGAYRAVRRSVYKQVLGGNISILDGKWRRGGNAASTPTRAKREGMRGGNRIPRSDRTEQMQSYTGADLAFVLRFLNQGTTTRASRYGNRGAIAPRNFFEGASAKAVEEAARTFCELVDAIINKQWQQ